MGKGSTTLRGYTTLSNAVIGTTASPLPHRSSGRTTSDQNGYAMHPGDIVLQHVDGGRHVVVRWSKARREAPMPISSP